jgi:hypothetical protein
MSRFTLTPTLYNKLIGRGMELVCSSAHCMYNTGSKSHNDKKWEQSISPKGYGICPRCKRKTPIIFFEYDEKKALEMAHNSKCQYRSKASLVVPKCSACSCLMNKEHIVYTQEVVSKHRKSTHYYYHAECYDAMFVAEDGEIPNEPLKRKYKMRYAGAHGKGCIIYLSFDPRKGICEACGKSKAKQEIKMTSLHHWRYAYAPETVKKTPMLILDNTVELCFACHQIADGLRNVMRLSPDRAMRVVRLMPKDLKAKFSIICQEENKDG